MVQYCADHVITIYDRSIASLASTQARSADAMIGTVTKDFDVVCPQFRLLKRRLLGLVGGHSGPNYRSPITASILMKHLTNTSKRKPLVTLGDAVQSLLETPDPTTENMCLVDKREFSAKKPWSAKRDSYEHMLLSASFLIVRE